VWEDDLDTNQKEVKGIKEQEVYMGEIPLMTESGTFIINGTQRVIVSQMHRSPGAFYFHDGGKSNTMGKYIYSARVIPYRGSWLDFEFDTKDVLFFRIDRKRKLPVTTLLLGLGYNRDEISQLFYKSHSYKYDDGGWTTEFIPEHYRNQELEFDLVDIHSDELLFPKGTMVSPRLIRRLKKEGRKIYHKVDLNNIEGKFIANTVHTSDGSEVIINAGDSITSDAITYMVDTLKCKEIRVLDVNDKLVGKCIVNTLAFDKNKSKKEALLEIYRIVNAGDAATYEVAEGVLSNIFFNPDRYNLSMVGRMKINVRHNLNVPEEQTCLLQDDIIAVMKNLVHLKNGHGEIDDIDSLSNRRIRPVGELIENQFRLGFVRIERAILERMNMVEIDNVMPHDLVSYKSLTSVINEFFGTSQLSQFMDQTNPLSEITHKRRISALGPGGLTRERAGFEVRDVHTTHYGRMCPIETPEGQNIGLINSLATYATINKYGFLETPYRKVKNGRVLDEVVSLSAIEESKYIIAQANAQLDNDGYLQEEIVTARKNGELSLSARDSIDYMDISPKQLVSVAASLIPFLENDDANRALMGSNMQRQAVPLLSSEAPLVGTGMESVVAKDSTAVITAKRAGIVESVDAHRIVIKADDKSDGTSDAIGVDIYSLIKYKKSNQGTCINQVPLVKIGDRIDEGSIIADGPCTDLGELALGKNVFVAFMPWNGYNFEDSILISERVVRDDVFTSVHIEEFEVIARDTRLGPEEITRDIPNISERNLQYLDETGIIHVGSNVKAGHILVGKVTPKSESPLTSEEKLLRAIFGEKAAEVRDTSLRLPSGNDGTVIGVRMFTRRGVDKSERAIYLEAQEVKALIKNYDDHISIVENYVYNKLQQLLVNQKVTKIVDVPINLSQPLDSKLSAYLSKLVGNKITKANLADIKQLAALWAIVIADKKKMKQITSLEEFLSKTNRELKEKLDFDIKKVHNGEDLQHGALKVVKVYVATKLKLQPGDKIAGRHGNKGVVSKIVPVEDMPFMEDGTPVDIVLNPLGVPSRMNLGQIFETHMGFASMTFGKQISQILDSSYSQGTLIKMLKEKLTTIYGDEENDNGQDAVSTINSMEAEHIVELCENLRSGVPIATPVFDGVKEKDIDRWLTKAGLDTSGQVKLRDGRTGELFERDVTVGMIYMMKLDHMVDNKMHARATGSYSLVTQQPLGGRSHFGGQRFGEMECWALQAYGAAYTLQEMLTVKSDDVNGRVEAYDAIVKGNHGFECGIPETFNVIIKELRSLGLNIELLEDNADGGKLVDDVSSSSDNDNSDSLVITDDGGAIEVEAEEDVNDNDSTTDADDVEDESSS